MKNIPIEKWNDYKDPNGNFIIKTKNTIEDIPKNKLDNFTDYNGNLYSNEIINYIKTKFPMESWKTLKYLVDNTSMPISMKFLEGSYEKYKNLPPNEWFEDILDKYGI